MAKDELVIFLKKPMYRKSPIALIKDKMAVIHKISSENLFGNTIADAKAKKKSL
nr:hypothetical protein [Chryseobacterium sp. G0201]